ncbi:MAG: GNAT family N-acetyltransferase [Acidimicrobiia bacterium]|nr:GNAT family N-acetyltransferase [Acidimicrobiia bacterium]
MSVTGRTEPISTNRLVLTPLRVEDAGEMYAVLADPELYEYTGGEAPSLERLSEIYRAQTSGSPTDGETWHNWVLRDIETGTALGFVQATVTGTTADVAWVVGVPWQRKGLAREAAIAMCAWLRGSGVVGLTAHIHPDHSASAAVAASAGLEETDALDPDGERVWRWPAPTLPIA